MNQFSFFNIYFKQFFGYQAIFCHFNEASEYRYACMTNIQIISRASVGRWGGRFTVHNLILSHVMKPLFVLYRFTTASTRKRVLVHRKGNRDEVMDLALLKWQCMNGEQEELQEDSPK